MSELKNKLIGGMGYQLSQRSKNDLGFSIGYNPTKFPDIYFYPEVFTHSGAQGRGEWSLAWFHSF